MFSILPRYPVMRAPFTIRMKPARQTSPTPRVSAETAIFSLDSGVIEPFFAPQSTTALFDPERIGDRDRARFPAIDDEHLIAAG